jgi:hypothetical protein
VSHCATDYGRRSGFAVGVRRNLKLAKQIAHTHDAAVNEVLMADNQHLPPTTVNAHLTNHSVRRFRSKGF